MARLNPINAGRVFVDANGLLTQESRLALDMLIQLIPITGDGAPEGVVEAIQGATYYDLSASTGSIHYVKKVSDVSGDRSKGWELA